MLHYFFDTRDNGTFIEDDVGLEMSSLEEAKIEATRCLTEMAREVLPGSVRHDLAVEVRTALRPVMTAMMRFEALVLA